MIECESAEACRQLADGMTALIPDLIIAGTALTIIAYVVIRVWMDGDITP